MTTTPMQNFDPNPVSYESDRAFSRRTKILFLLYGIIGLALGIML